MELTVHANERILGRTKMLTQDVLSLIIGGAVVKLGSSHRYEYLLFYSPPDRRTKVAIVTRERTALISVWETDYPLPKNIGRVTHRLEKLAERRVREFLFWRIKENGFAQKPAEHLVRIRVIEGKRCVYEYDAGMFLSLRFASRKAVIEAASPALKRIHSIVEENKSLTDKKVTYDVCVIDPETQKVVRMCTVRDTASLQVLL